MNTLRDNQQIQAKYSRDVLASTIGMIVIQGAENAALVRLQSEKIAELQAQITAIGEANASISKDRVETNG